jgi:hypothetical protein
MNKKNDQMLENLHSDQTLTYNNVVDYCQLFNDGTNRTGLYNR